METEVCPSCGKFVDELVNETGFCETCSGALASTNQDFLVERFLELNADELEFYLYQGKSLNQAIDLLHNGKRSTCIVCGSVLKYAPRTAVFCRAQKECRRYARRYVYLYSEKGMSKSEALALVLEELT